MRVSALEIPGVLLLEPRVYKDGRGFFLESFNARSIAAEAGIHHQFVQDNHSRSHRGVLRGLHYQIQNPQGKLVRCLRGRIYDVVVDLRRASPSFGRWLGVELSADNFHQLWVPPGLAHGFLVLSDVAEVFYKATDYYAPESERCIRWDDPTIAITWPLDGLPTVSPKDALGVPFAHAEAYSSDPSAPEVLS